MKQDFKVQNEYTKDNETINYKNLKKEFGTHKRLPRHYGLQALLALSHYPELKEIKIEFVFVESNQPLSAQPKKSTLLLSAKERTYIVNISKKASKEIEPVLLRNLPFNVQVSQFGHELGHILDYMDKSSIEFVKDSLLYMTDEHKRKMEMTADTINLKHGFGLQMLEYYRIIEKMSKQYPEEKFYSEYDMHYMTEDDIKAGINKYAIYKNGKK